VICFLCPPLIELLEYIGPYVSEQEIEKIANTLRGQGEPNYIEEITSSRK